MKPATHFLKLLAIGALLIEGLLSTSAIAGPATYDPETKSFRFRYTFTNAAGSPQELGAVVKPSTEQEAKVNELVSAVSQILFQATEGRAKIGRLDYVDNVKDADLVVSLSPRPASSGVSNLHTIEGNPGHLVLYYQTLLPYIRQDVVNTSVHELGHYVFGLADEYDYGNFPGGCPPDPSLKSPGCLMDNYLSSARNWMGRFCRDGEHNKTATQERSCQSIVDQFFADRGVTDKDPTALAAPNIGSGKETVIASTLGKVRAEIEKKTAASGGSQGSVASGLVGFARKTLASLIKDFNQNNPSKVLLNSNQLSKAVDLIVKASTALPINKPLGLTDGVFDRIKAEAKRLGEESSEKPPSARFSKVRSGLQAFVKTLLGENQFSAENFDKNEQKALVDRLAHAESRTNDEKALDQLASMSAVQLDYSQRMARWIVTVLDEMDAPGTRSRLDELAVVENRLKAFAIPGRTAQGFGQRRSRFITPDPVDEHAANVSTQGGVFPYNDIRDRGFLAFSRLINRERIELVTPRFNNGVNAAPLEVRIDRPLEPRAENEPEIRRQQTNNNLLAFLNDTFNQLERNRLENIALLVPPGAVPDDLRSYLQVMKTKLREDHDVRLDIVLVGPATIPPELRDLSVKWHGSVLTVTDLDEVGAIAQRLKNEQSSGAWVIVPQVSTIPQKDQAAVEQFAAQQADPGAPAQDPQDPRSFAKELRDEILARKQIIDAMIGEVNQKLENLRDPTKQVSPLSEAVKRQVENASVNLKTFKYLLEQLEDGEKNRDLTQTDEVARSLNRKVMDLIVQAHDSLRSLEGSISVAADTTNVEANANLSNLIDLAKGYSKPNDPNEKADPDHKADPKEKDSPKEELLTPEFFQKLIDKAADTEKKRFKAFKCESISKLERRFKTFKCESISKLERLKRFLRLHEKWYEAALRATKDDVPIYKRLDRTKLDGLRKQVEDVQVMKAVGHKVAPTIGAGPNDVRLARFYVEAGGKMGDFNFELVVGLARALPQVFNSTTKRPELRLPSLDLYSDNGIIAADARNMKLEKSLSDATLLVFRAQDPSRLSEGWYTPVLRFDKEVMDQIKAPNEINFTFSVASLRPNIQLIASLRQPDGTKTRGTIHSGEQEAVVEVLVSAGSPIRGAKVYGYFQRINTGNDDIETQEVVFQDQGKTNPLDADTLKDDGLYTAKIPIANVTKGTEFRVFIQADTTDGTARFVALDDPNRFNPVVQNDQNQPVQIAKKNAKKSTMTKTLEAFQTQGSEDQKKAEGPAPKFQRATSLHFRVEP